MIYDGQPVIDRTPAMDERADRRRHNMLGLSMATGTGKLVAEMLRGTKPHIDPGPYSPGRFSEPLRPAAQSLDTGRSVRLIA